VRQRHHCLHGELPAELLHRGELYFLRGDHWLQLVRGDRLHIVPEHGAVLCACCQSCQPMPDHGSRRFVHLTGRLLHLPRQLHLVHAAALSGDLR